MSRVFVTGNAGFVMSHVVDRLLENGHTVFGVDNLDGGSMTNVRRDSFFTEGSICDASLIAKIFDSFQPDFCIHGAAFAAENLSNNTRVFTIQNNLVGEAVVRNACINHDVKCMVSLSSIAVMGHQTPPFDDDTQPAPRDVYGVMKYSGEIDARCAYEFHGLPYVVLRPHNVVGLRQNAADQFRNVATIFIRQTLEGKPLTIFGDGSQTRAFSPVSYVSRVIAETIERKKTWNKAFNVGSDMPITVLNLAQLISRLCGVPENFQFLEARKEALHAHMSHDKCRKFFPDIPDPEPLDKTLTDMIADARLKGFPPMQKGPEIEIEKGLPEIWKTNFVVIKE